MFVEGLPLLFPSRLRSSRVCPYPARTCYFGGDSGDGGYWRRASKRQMAGQLGRTECCEADERRCERGMYSLPECSTVDYGMVLSRYPAGTGLFRPEVFGGDDGWCGLAVCRSGVR